MSPGQDIPREAADLKHAKIQATTTNIQSSKCFRQIHHCLNDYSISPAENPLL